MNDSLSLVMIVKNESTLLGRCLNSAKKYVDEIIVVDTGSTDDTKQIAAKFGALVFDYQWNENFAEARNFALDQSSSDWNLVLDADEFISNDCKMVLQKFINSRKSIGKIKRIDKFVGEDGINHEQSFIPRLFPSYCRYGGRVHEQIISDLPRVLIDVQIEHDGYLHHSRTERNIPILALELAEHPNHPYYHFQIAKEYRGLQAHEKSFIHLQKAYSLITHHEAYAPNVIINYLYSIINSGHLDEGIKIIESEEEFMKGYPDFYFVSALFLLEFILRDPDRYSRLLPYIERFYIQALEIGETEREGGVIGTGSFAVHHNLAVFYEVTVTERRQYTSTEKRQMSMDISLLWKD